jgi:hypothetical protein
MPQLTSDAMVETTRFCIVAIRLGKENPQYKDNVAEALKAVRRAQLRMAADRPAYWKRHPAVQRVVLDMFERYGVVVY